MFSVVLTALAAAPLFVSAALNITVYQPNVTLFPTPLPPPHAAASPDELVAAFNNLGRTTNWHLVSAIPFEGDTYEPEGMVRIGEDRIVVSAGEYIVLTKAYGTNPDGSTIIINGTDRTPGVGFAHFIIFDGNGTRLADATLTQVGAMEYHNGGIDYDGEFIWGTIAQYRPNSTAYAYKSDPYTLTPQVIAHVADHQGGVVHDTQTDTLYTLNWGSRNASTLHTAGNAAYPAFTTPFRVQRNPSYYVDYQDCKFVGHPACYDYRSTMLCSGVATIGSGNQSYNLGGIALVDTETMVPVSEVPIAMRSELGIPITQNPVDAAMVDGKLRLYWLPDQHNSTLYVYEAEPQSPYEYGGSGGTGQSYEIAP